MSKREEIIKLMEMYNKNLYATEIFCDLFSELYYYENKGREEFDDNEQIILDELGVAVARYSPYIEDIEQNPDTYFDEGKIKKIFYKIYNKFNQEKIDLVKRKGL